MAVLGDGSEDLGIGGDGDGVEHLSAHRRRDVQLLGGAGEEEEILDCLNFGTARNLHLIDGLVGVSLFSRTRLLGEGEGSVVQR